MEQLVLGAEKLGLVLREADLARFRTYYDELVEWNQRFNLTAITDYVGVQVRHFVDSLSCLMVLSQSDLQAGARPTGICRNLIKTATLVSVQEAFGFGY